MRAIARRLGRSPNTISHELGENAAMKGYDPVAATRKAKERRRDAKYQGMKIVGTSELQKYVNRHLYDDLSPEAIAGRLKRHEWGLPYASKDSIRRYLKTAYAGAVDWYRTQQKRKRTWSRKRPRVAELADRTFIDKRPISIQKRRGVGHAEADFIVSGRTGKGIILTLADRKLRVSFLERILPVTIPNVERAFLRIKKRFPELKSITTDNDILFRHHKRLERLLGVKIYFCHPYRSWEKGTIENTNKYIRRDIPKGSDISRYSKRFIKNLEAKLNRRYMKVLDYRTPQEMIDRERKKRLRVLKKKRKQGVLLEP